MDRTKFYFVTCTCMCVMVTLTDMSYCEPAFSLQAFFILEHFQKSSVKCLLFVAILAFFSRTLWVYDNNMIPCGRDAVFVLLVDASKSVSLKLCGSCFKKGIHTSVHLLLQRNLSIVVTLGTTKRGCYREVTC